MKKDTKKPKETKKPRDITWKDLSKPTIRSTVYTVCMTPQRQKDITSIIYERNPRDVGRNMVVTACRDLKNSGFCEIIQKFPIKNSEYKSTHKPVFQYCKNFLEIYTKESSRQNSPVLTDSDEHLFKLIFDSQWFGSFFYPKELKNPDNLRKAARIEKNRLKVYDSLKMISTLYSIVCSTTLIFASENKIRKILPDEKELAGVENFDGFAEKWVRKPENKKVEKLIEKSIFVSRKNFGTQINSFLEAITKKKYFLAIPYDFAAKMHVARYGKRSYDSYIRDSLKRVKST